MKTFVTYFSNKQRHLMTEKLIKDHASYLYGLKKKGVLPFCGPCKDGTALMIFKCSSYDDVSQFVENDPFSKVNYYMDRKIIEIEEANEENNFLLSDVLD